MAGDAPSTVAAAVYIGKGRRMGKSTAHFHSIYFYISRSMIGLTRKWRHEVIEAGWATTTD